MMLNPTLYVVLCLPLAGVRLDDLAEYAAYPTEAECQRAHGLASANVRTLTAALDAMDTYALRQRIGPELDRARRLEKFWYYAWWVVWDSPSMTWERRVEMMEYVRGLRTQLQRGEP